MRKDLLFQLEFRGVHTAPAAPQFHGMFQVKHLVVNNVLDRVTRDPGMVEDPTDHDGIMRRIVMAEAVAGVIAALGHLGTCQESEKETLIEVLEDLVEVVHLAARGLYAFTTA